MKKVLFLSLIIFAFFFSCKTAPESTTETIVSSSDNNLIEYLNSHNQVVVSAHRGGSGIPNYPENALETIAYLYAQNIQTFEVDVIQTVDDELMLLHDDFLERTTNGNGSIKGLNSDELLTYNLVDDFGNETSYKIPYLEQVLQWLQDKNAYLMIDFKRSASYEKVVNLIRTHNVENQCILIGYNIKQVKKLHELAPEMLLSVPARNEQELNWVLSTDIPTQKMMAFTGTRLSDDALYHRLNELKIPAILGTLGNLDKRAAARGDELYKKWADLGVQIIATDRPIDAYKALQ